MEEQVIHALTRGAEKSGRRAQDLYMHAIALAREAEAEALEASNRHGVSTRVAYPPMVLLLAQAVDDLA